MSRIDVNAVKHAAVGNWPIIFRELLGIEGRIIERPGRVHGPCPLCGGEDRFQFFKDAHRTGGSHCRGCGAKPDGFELVRQNLSLSFIDAVREVARVLNCEAPLHRHRAKPTPPPAVKISDERENRRLRAKLKKTWQQSLPGWHPKAEPMRRYLANRGLHVPQLPATLRFHPSMLSVDTETGEIEGRFPTMLALVVDRNGDPVTLHRTYLTPEGYKAPVASAKKLMAYPDDREVSGGAIHLSGTGPVLNVAEGIETAFAVQELVGGSIWATANASLMANLEIGEPVRALWVWSDLDRSGDGQSSAHKLVRRARERGLQATAVVPNVLIPESQKSVDWLDMKLGYSVVARERCRIVRGAQLRVAA